MANAYSTSDVIKGALQKVGELTDGNSSYHNLALKYVNEVYDQLLSGANEFDPEIGDTWVWARTSRSFTVLANYATGSVSLTNGLTAGAFSIAPSVSVAGYYLKINDEPTYYVIATHTAGQTAFTLDVAYLETTGVALSFNAIPLSYDLGSGILRLCEPLRIYVDRPIEYLEDRHDKGHLYGMDIDRFREEYPIHRCELRNAYPTKFATYFSSDTSWKVLVNNYTSTAFRVDFDYIAIQDGLVDSDLSLPLLPRTFRSILETGAGYYLAVDKGDEKNAAILMNRTKMKLKAMQLAEAKNRIVVDNTFGRLIPRRDGSFCRIKI